MDKTSYHKNKQWTFYISGELHIVDLKEDKLYVDREYVGKIETKCLINYEYKFKIGATECSLVKFVIDKEYDLVVDGKYLNKKRQYLPLTKPLFITYVFLIIDILALLAFTVLTHNSEVDPIKKLFYFLIVFAFAMCVGKVIKTLANCPCKIKGELLNKIYRLFFMLLIEGFYAFLIITVASFLI